MKNEIKIKPATDTEAASIDFGLIDESLLKELMQRIVSVDVKEFTIELYVSKDDEISAAGRKRLKGNVFTSST